MAAVAAASLMAAAAGSASAAVTTVFTGATESGGAVPCTALSDGVRVCHAVETNAVSPDLRVKAWDGVPLEAYVTLPPAPVSGTDGMYPTIALSHGYGSSASGKDASGAALHGYDNNEYFGRTAEEWAKAGYATVQLSARGFGESCGSSASRLVSPTACAQGWVKLDDVRYEARDVQSVLGELVDEGVSDPARLGATGESYGGGVALELATLKDRVYTTDAAKQDSLIPWKSAKGTPLALAAAAPVIPWSDLAYSLVPNGRTSDLAVTPNGADTTPFGVEKQSFVSGLYAIGQASGYYAPPMADPNADLTTWFAALNAGEPYDTNPTDTGALMELELHHSPYSVLSNLAGLGQEAPTPLLVANGFTDDLFPVDEALRYRAFEQSLYPNDPFYLVDGDFGHQRGQNKAADLAVLKGAITIFFDRYLMGATPTPPAATALTQTCPKTAAAEGPFTAGSWEALHPGALYYVSQGTAQATQTVSSSAGSTQISQAIDPIGGSGACATVAAADQGTGVASYRLPPATGSGYTLIGAPLVAADLTVSGQYPFLAERLWDVDPATNTETLVARGVYRIDASKPNGEQVFELHPGAWHFLAGHVAKLELLGQDSPYLRSSNGSFTITVKNLGFRLPVRETFAAPPVAAPPSGPPAAPGAGTPPRRAVCGAVRPLGRITRGTVRATRRGLRLSGTARETPCATATAATRVRERPVRVYLTAVQRAGTACRYLLPSGRLTPRRSCARPVRLVARGSSRWSLRIAHRIAPGRYRITVDAVDGRHVHQAADPGATVTVAVR